MAMETDIQDPENPGARLTLASMDCTPSSLDRVAFEHPTSGRRHVVEPGLVAWTGNPGTPPSPGAAVIEIVPRR